MSADEVARAKADKRRQSFDAVQSSVAGLLVYSVKKACQDAGVPRSTYYRLLAHSEEYRQNGFRDRRVKRLANVEVGIGVYIDKPRSTAACGSCEKLAKAVAEIMAEEKATASQNQEAQVRAVVPIGSRESVRRFLHRQKAKYVRKGHSRPRWYADNDDTPTRTEERRRNEQTNAAAVVADSRGGLEQPTGAPKGSTGQRSHKKNLLGRLERKMNRLDIRAPITALVKNHSAEFIKWITMAGDRIFDVGPQSAEVLAPDGQRPSGEVAHGSYSWCDSKARILELAFQLKRLSKSEWLYVKARGELPFRYRDAMCGVESAHLRVAKECFKDGILREQIPESHRELDNLLSEFLRENLESGSSSRNQDGSQGDIERALRARFEQKLIRALAKATRIELKDALLDRVKAVRGASAEVTADNFIAEPGPLPLPPAPLGLRYVYWTSDVPKAMRAGWLKKARWLDYQEFSRSKNRDQAKDKQSGSTTEYVDYIKKHGCAPARIGAHASARELAEYLEQKGIPGETLLIAGLQAMRDRVMKRIAATKRNPAVEE